ncbi:MAG: phosphodiester glycosidase family protein [Alicyclobacillus sp.]|nr:phosphodiester glycosidase family protein [Alicyclobacillus sp.]
MWTSGWLAGGALAAGVLLTLPAPTAAAAEYSMHQDSIRVNGQQVSSPYGLVAHGTTYMPIWYVQQAMNTIGVPSTWDGATWDMKTPQPVSLPNHNTGSGTVTLSVNGTAVMSVNGITAVDPASQQETTFVPIWYIQQVLNRLGLVSHWDGQHWDISNQPTWRDYITTGTVTVADGAGSQTVTYVRINTQNPYIRVEPVLADHHVGSVASLADLAQSNHALVAINGTFFNSYSDQTPQGALMMNGQFQHLWGPVLLGIGKDGSLLMTRADTTAVIHLHNPNVSPAQLTAWGGINSWQGQPFEVSLLTPFYGSHTNIPFATSVVVEQGVVTGISTGDTPIPQDGYVIELADPHLASLFKQGDAVDYTVTLTSLTDHKPIDLSNLQSALGAGPLLLDNGQIVLNPALDGLTDTSLLNSVTRRSFAGIDEDGNLVLATVRFANMEQLAQIASHMHLRAAMNLDGGASSGLYVQGHYLLEPGRPLAAALTVRFQAP